MIQWLLCCALLWRLLQASAEPSAIIVFGDSTVDTGTNFHLTSTPHNFQANRYPYGLKAFAGNATGRFTEGRIIVDYIADYAGFPLVEPYVKPGADLSRGVNFGSGGAGALAGTNDGMVLHLDQQLQNFLEFCESRKNTKFLSNAVYLISIGSNDYLSGYFSSPDLQARFTPDQFVGMVVSNITNAVEVLHSKGARKFVIFGVGPLGCLPPLRILNGTGGCLEMASTLGEGHNYGLALALEQLRKVHGDSLILGAHFFDFFLERQNNYEAHGFKEPFQACCGAGPFRGLGHCGLTNPHAPAVDYELCEDPSAHVWWDPYHPSERVHQQFAEALWTGGEGTIEPLNLKQLFEFSLPLVVHEEL